MQINIKNEILKEHSKSNVIRISELIGNDHVLFKQLMKLFFNYKKMNLARKAAWVMRECANNYPFLIIPYIEKLIQYLYVKELHDAIKRNILGVIKDIGIPEKHDGEITDLCFRFLMDKKESVAVRVFAMIILAEIGKKLPEINHELKLILEDHIPYGTAGFKSRAQKILKS
jgi:hypothetical protein